MQYSDPETKHRVQMSTLFRSLNKLGCYKIQDMYNYKAHVENNLCLSKVVLMMVWKLHFYSVDKVKLSNLWVIYGPNTKHVYNLNG